MDKIYKLIDPNTLEIRYVGYTNRRRLSHRLSCHLSESKRLNKCHRHWWINSLRKKGQRPIIELIKFLPKRAKKSWQYWETYFIDKYKKLGYDLTNGTLGGDGQTGMKHSEKTKRRIRRSCKNLGKGRVFTEEHCENISKAHKGKKLSKTHKENLRLAGLGRVQTKETREKISLANRLREEDTRRKPIKSINVITGETRSFDSINDAIRQLEQVGISLHRQQISLILNGRLSKKKYRRFQAKGYFWEYS